MPDQSPLVAAAYAHDWQKVAELRTRDGVADLFEAAIVGDVAAAAGFVQDEPALLAARADDGFTALHLAAYFDRPGVVDLLLAAGADVEAVAPGSALRPLHAAVAARSAVVAASLLAAGAGADVRQHGGWTPLMAAASHGDRAIVVSLLDAGASTAIAADDGRIAADMAAPEVADLLGD